jgi:hypothetical protein
MGPSIITRDGDGWAVVVPVYLGEVVADDVRVELYADATETTGVEAIALTRAAPIAGASNGYRYVGRTGAGRPPVSIPPASFRIFAARACQWSCRSFAGRNNVTVTPRHHPSMPIF